MSDGPRIRLPHNWMPRNYQLPVLRALARGVRRAVCVWHRRAGKDDVCMHWTACAAHTRIGTYWHMLPKASQARKAIWTAVNPHTGVRRIDEAFPLEIRATTNEQEMFIRFQNGSTWQVVGSDNFNSLVGSPPVGVVFSEFSLADPHAWSILRPILVENDGWALFITTPRGKNHAMRMYEGALGDPLWFAQKLTVDDTGVISAGAIAQERAEMTREMGAAEAEAMIQQEYYCSFEAAIPGSYYGSKMGEVERGNRILDLPYDPRDGVVTAWDIGYGDATAIVYLQQPPGPWVHVLDYDEENNRGADFFAKTVREKEYVYDEHLLPHDVNVHEWGANGTTRLASLRDMNVNPIRVLKKTSVEDRINATRLFLNRCKFDRVKTERLRDALANYQKIWDDKAKMFREVPLHDWTSHGCDAFGYGAQGFRAPENRRRAAYDAKAKVKQPKAAGAWGGSAGTGAWMV